jgi:hypothetical protein
LWAMPLPPTYYDVEKENNTKVFASVYIPPVAPFPPPTFHPVAAATTAYCCPQCHRPIYDDAARIVSEACGHWKCRQCLMGKETCLQCTTIRAVLHHQHQEHHRQQQDHPVRALPPLPPPAPSSASQSWLPNHYGRIFPPLPQLTQPVIMESIKEEERSMEDLRSLNGVAESGTSREEYADSTPENSVVDTAAAAGTPMAWASHFLARTRMV